MPAAAAGDLRHHRAPAGPVGSALAVFDFGGGTLDIAVVRNEGVDQAGRANFAVIGSGGLAELGGLDLDAVGEVSRAVSAAMDAAEPVHGAYVLEVSTPGTDRPLTELRHFRRARTRLVTLTLTGGSTLHGRLVDATATGYEVETADGTVHVAPGDVVRGAVEVELRRADEHTGDLPDDEGDA